MGFGSSRRRGRGRPVAGVPPLRDGEAGPALPPHPPEGLETKRERPEPPRRGFFVSEHLILNGQKKPRTVTVVPAGLRFMGLELLDPGRKRGRRPLRNKRWRWGGFPCPFSLEPKEMGRSASSGNPNSSWLECSKALRSPKRARRYRPPRKATALDGFLGTWRRSEGRDGSGPSAAIRGL